MSQEGTTCWGWAPTGMVSMTLYVTGSMTDTVLEVVFGTYTRDGKSLTTGESLFGRSAAYTSCGSRSGGIPARPGGTAGTALAGTAWPLRAEGLGGSLVG